MKMIGLFLVALLLASTPVSAAITGTAHDLSSTGTNAFKGSSDEICVYCHTPHGAGAAGFAPLWNRTTANATAVYSGVDIQATYDLASVNQTDAPLCLSCHDGASLASNLTNPPNVGGQPTFSGGEITGMANLGTDLTNDHPIGFDYSAINALDAEIDTLVNATGKGVQFFNGGTDMWCSSCHDVHDDTEGAFLITTNSGSDLCLACHIK